MSTEQVRAFFDAHRTIRQYQTQPDGTPMRLPSEQLDTILHAAQRAPTDATAQLYSIIWLDDLLVRRQVAELTLNPHVATASEVFVMCADVWRVKQLLTAGGRQAGEWPQIGLHFGLGDAVLAGQNLLISAEMLGLSGCWIGGVVNKPEEISKLLQLPSGVLPFAALTIGTSAESPPQRPRLPRKMVVHTNSYQQTGSEQLLAAVPDMNPIAAVGDRQGDWLRLLNGYFGKGRAMQEREAGLAALVKRQGFTTESSK